jgi:hypothetical protein
LDIDLPALDEARATLVPDTREKRGGGKWPALDVSPVLLGHPVTQAVSPDLLDTTDPLRSFLDHDGVSDYHVVYFGVSLWPGAGYSFASAWVTVDLSPNETDGKAAIAWSLTPLKQASQRKRTSSLTLGANAEFIEAGAGISSEYTEDRTYLAAYGLQASSFSWEFTRTRYMALEGSYRLTAVVRAPKQAPVSGELGFAASLDFTRYGVVPYRAELAGETSIRFSVR